MKVLFLASASNGLTQRAWCALRAAGHQVTIEPAGTPESIAERAELAKPDIVVSLFPAGRVPVEVGRHWRTIVIEPGPAGDLAPTPLDRAILDRAPAWGVAARQTAGGPGSGALWASRTVAMPATAVRRSELYRGPVADAVLECLAEVLDKAADPGFVPQTGPAAGGGNRMGAGPEFAWEAPAEDVARRVRAVDGAPGAPATLLGTPVRLYDAHVGYDAQGRPMSGPPGAVVGRYGTAVLVGTGTGSVWIGQLRRAEAAVDGDPPAADGTSPPAVGGKLPAAVVLRGALRGVPELRPGPPPWLTYTRSGPVGTLTFRPYNGVLSTRQCRRVHVALRYALSQPTRALVVRGADDVFGFGIHLGMIEAAGNPAAEAWANVRALNDVCRRLCSLSRQHVITAYTGAAAAGGAMLGLAGDVVLARSGIVLNPYYDMGLSGSQLHTYTLPARVGARDAERLLTERLPVDAARAVSIGLVDAAGPADPAEFADWLAERAAELAAGGSGLRPRRTAAAQRPLAYYETAELAEAARDIFDDRDGFSGRRRTFLARGGLR